MLLTTIFAGLIAALEIVLIAIVLFMKEKIKNAASIEDIRRITGEQQVGKLEIDAAKEVMVSIARSAASMDKLSLRMSLEALEKRDGFQPPKYGLAIYDLWTELAGSLDRNYILLPTAAREEINYFKEEWPHFLGGKEYGWLKAVISTAFIKSSALGVFRARMSDHLDLAKSKTAKKRFDRDEAKIQYSIASLNTNSGKLNSELALNLISCGISIPDVKMLFPDQKFTFTDGDGKTTHA